MKTKNIHEEKNELILFPANYKILYWILILILILLFPLFVYVSILILIQITDILKDSNWALLYNINEIEYTIVLFYLLNLLGFNIIRITRKYIPQKIKINKDTIQLIYKNSKLINLKMDLWQYIYIYKFRHRQSKFNYILLINTIHNIKFELFESNIETLSRIVQYFKSNTKLKVLENFNMKPNPLSIKNLSYETKEILLKNKSRYHIFSIVLSIVIYFVFLTFFILQLEFEKFHQNDWFYIGTILIFSLIYIIIFIYIISSMIKLFFDTKIIKDKDKISIYYQFFSPLIPINIKRREFYLNRNLILNLNLFYDRKISFIEIYHQEDQNPPSLWKKLLKINYYKIQCFGYYIDEIFEIYNELIKHSNS